MHVLVQILCRHRLLQDIEYTSLSHTGGPCCLSVLYLAGPVPVNPKFLIYPSPTFPFGNHVFSYVYESVS